MIRNKIRKCCSVVLIFTMLLSCFVSTSSEYAFAASKKAVISTKTLSITVGSGKSIVLSNKQKGHSYYYRTANSKIASVSSKGWVKALKEGTVSITVTEKYKLKKKVKTSTIGTVVVTIKKSGNVTPTLAPIKTSAPTAKPTSVPTALPTVVPTAQPTAVPTVKPTAVPTATAAPTPAPTTVSLKLDLKKAADQVSYDDVTGFLHATNILSFRVPLGVTLKANQKVSVNVVGATDQNGFRSWFVDSSLATSSNFFISQDNSINGTEFNTSYTLTATSAVDGLLFKGKDFQTNISDLTIRSITITYTSSDSTDVVVKKDFVPTTSQYNGMISKALLSSGNNSRIKKTIERAKAGEKVSIACIGGSITEGANVVADTSCYVADMGKAFKGKYGKQDNVTVINAGMSGTPSSLGVIRYNRDVIRRLPTGQTRPDIVVIEFAVNDYGECTGGEAYESMIRNALGQGSAVILMFSTFKQSAGASVMQSSYLKYGQKYDLPMISMYNGTQEYFTTEGYYDWYFSDSLHPNRNGYQLMADCLTNLFTLAESEVAEADNIGNINGIAPVTGDAFVGIDMLERSTDITKVTGIKSIELGSFADTDANGQNFQYTYNGVSNASWFPSNWMHTSGSNGLKINATCSNLMLVYKLSGSTTFGTAEIYVDGVLKKTISGYSTSGWNNATTELVFKNSTATDHVIEIKMKAGDENKTFTVLAMGYTSTPSYYSK